MNNLIITSRQIRAARGLIGWSQNELAKAVGISRSTIAAIENGTGNPTLDMISRIRETLEGKQVEFLTQEGVRFREPTIRYDDMQGASMRLVDNIYKVAMDYKKKTGTNDILIYGVREDDAEDVLGDYLQVHIDRLQAAGLTEKLLCSPDTKYLAPRSWYRKMQELKDNQHLPVVVYGEKLAVIQRFPKEAIVIVDSKPIADSFRSMFQYIWKTVREN
jgi:transcriptional regulator with XRE-family HTH domain